MVSKNVELFVGLILAVLSIIGFVTNAPLGAQVCQNGTCTGSLAYSKYYYLIGLAVGLFIIYLAEKKAGRRR